jgi:ABC-type polysaccharide/polyol phosphate export permease
MPHPLDFLVGLGCWLGFGLAAGRVAPGGFLLLLPCLLVCWPMATVLYFPPLFLVLVLCSFGTSCTIGSLNNIYRLKK